MMPRRIKKICILPVWSNIDWMFLAGEKGASSNNCQRQLALLFLTWTLNWVNYTLKWTFRGSWDLFELDRYTNPESPLLGNWQVARAQVSSSVYNGQLLQRTSYCSKGWCQNWFSCLACWFRATKPLIYNWSIFI